MPFFYDILFLKEVGFDLNTLCPTFLQSFDPLQMGRLIKVLEKGFPLKDDFIGLAKSLFSEYSFKVGNSKLSLEAWILRAWELFVVLFIQFRHIDYEHMHPRITVMAITRLSLPAVQPHGRRMVLPFNCSRSFQKTPLRCGFNFL